MCVLPVGLELSFRGHRGSSDVEYGMGSRKNVLGFLQVVESVGNIVCDRVPRMVAVLEVGGATGIAMGLRTILRSRLHKRTTAPASENTRPKCRIPARQSVPWPSLAMPCFPDLHEKKPKGLSASLLAMALLTTGRSNPGMGVASKPPSLPKCTSNVFVIPADCRSFLKAGIWPDGTTLVLDIRSLASKLSITAGDRCRGAYSVPRNKRSLAVAALPN